MDPSDPSKAGTAAPSGALAIYDMDKTVTRRPTYGYFLLHAALRLAPWRLLLAPALALTGLAYALRLIDRARLKEVNYRLLVGRPTPERLEPVVQRFAERQLRTNILPGARRRLAKDKAAGRRLVLATASYRLYAAAIAERLGFDDVIATETLPDSSGRIVARIDGAIAMAWASST
ncbi:MAG TPA: HAD family hydrolase [Allosphingosinicella sp.]|nr:HAD family hydrolase [Allosphingosinicella sp.]